MINKVVQLPNGYIVNDLFFIQEGAPMYQEILDWIADGGQVDEYIVEQPSQEMLLESAKSKKIQELETAYRAAQWIQVRNGHIFFVPLAGSDWVTIETACLSAYMRGVADLIWQDIDGNIQTLKDLPLTEWQKFYSTAKPIGVSNKDIRVRKEIDINNCQTQAELDAVVWIFPAITEVIVDI